MAAWQGERGILRAPKMISERRSITFGKIQEPAEVETVSVILRLRLSSQEHGVDRIDVALRNVPVAR